jgi:hypothetical protein
MKHWLAFLIVSASYSLAQAQQGVHCKLLDIAAADWNNTVSLGTCSTSPPLWKRVTYQSSSDLGIKWQRLCDTCSTPYGYTVPSVFSSGACYAPDGYVLEECWPVFLRRVITMNRHTAETFSLKPLKVRVSAVSTLRRLLTASRIPH